MAIKVSGTSVINDSRQLQNIASLDSTTISTINANVSAGPPTPNTQTFTSSGTWSKPSGSFTYVIVDLIGGGGGGAGGGCNSNPAAGHPGGSGGAAGNRNIFVLPYSQAPSSATVTVGGGGGYGNGQSGAGNSAGSPGNQGGATRFGTFGEALGGAGGNASTGSFGQESAPQAVNNPDFTGAIAGAYGGSTENAGWTMGASEAGARGYRTGGGGGRFGSRGQPEQSHRGTPL